MEIYSPGDEKEMYGEKDKKETEGNTALSLHQCLHMPGCWN